VRDLYNDTVMWRPQLHRELEASKGQRSRPHEELSTVILNQQLVVRLDGITGREGETIIGNGRNEGCKPLLYHLVHRSELCRRVKPTPLHLEEPVCGRHLCHSTDDFLIQRREDMLPCESGWNGTPPLGRNLHRKRCVPEYREELHGDKDGHLHRGDLARTSIDYCKVFGVPDGHVRPIWALTRTDALHDGAEGFRCVFGCELSWSDRLKPRSYLVDGVLLWNHRKGGHH